MKKAIFGLAILVSVLASCSKAETADNGFSRISASSDSFTKAHFDFDPTVFKQLWDEGDCISVFTAEIPNGRKFTLASKAGSSTAEFASDVPVNDTTCYYALYPASAAGKATFSLYEGDALTVNFPSSVLFDYDKYCGDCCNFMVASSSDKFFFFRNIFSYIEFYVSGPDDDAIRSIVIQGQNEEILSGEARVTFNGDDPDVAFVSGGKSITVDFGDEGLALPTEVFDITVPPVLSLGFSVTVNTVNGLSKTFTSEPHPEFTINSIINMGEINMAGN